jgi:sugar/nucleoside kinase (ribokinase family)
VASSIFRYLLLGQLRRDYIITSNGQAYIDIPGGNLIYAAVGFSIWESESQPGLVARVGEDYPREWLEEFERRGFDTQGVRIVPEALDLRSFYAYTDRSTRALDDAVSHFAKHGLSFPKSLLGYRAPGSKFDSRVKLQSISLRQGDLPEEYLDGSAAHLCPVDYLTQSLIPAVLRQAGFTTVTVDPSPGMMTPTFWDEIPALVTGLTALIASEEEVRSLFHGRSKDLWEIAETLASYGCEYIVIKRGEHGQLVYDSTSRSRWEISSYPSRVVDPTGAGDAFCGGFLVGYRRTYDPIEAALHGNISASLVVEGSGPFYAQDALPGLAQARLAAVRETVRKI